MRLSVLLREAMRSAWAQKAPTALVAVLVATMCLATLLTVGRANAAQRQVETRLEDAGSRVLTVTDVAGADAITPAVIRVVGAASTVERAIGLSAPVDTTSAAVGPGGPAVPTWTVTGRLSDAVLLVDGRWPQVGEALVSEEVTDLLGLDAPVGALSDRSGLTSAGIVGTFRSRPPFDDLDAGAVVAAGPTSSLRTLAVVVSSADQVAETQNFVLTVMAVPDPAQLYVESPATLAEVQRVVVGDLAQYGRGLMLSMIGTGAGLVAVVALSDVLLRRRDLGRRRALGAPRWALMTLVVCRTLVAALAGAAMGTVAGLIATARAGHSPEPRFAISSAAIAVLAAGLAAIPPALVAAWQDPVRVLRTP